MSRGFLIRDTFFTIYFPDGYDPRSSYVLLYALHCYTCKQNEWFTKGELKKSIDKSINNKNCPPCIVVSIEAFDSWYLDDFESFFITRCIPMVEKLLSTHLPIQRGLIGISMGGYGALYYSFKYPHLFERIIAISSTIKNPIADKSILTMLKSLSREKIKDIKHVKYIIMCGTDDPLIDDVLKLLYEMEQKKISVISRITKGKHDWSYFKKAIRNVFLNYNTF